MARSLPNFHKMDSRSACIQGVLKVKVKVKGHVIRALSWILGMSYSVIDGLVLIITWLIPGVGGVDSRDPGVRELSRLSMFDDDVPALLYIHNVCQLALSISKAYV